MDATRFELRSDATFRARRRNQQLGATNVEYAFLLFAVLIACAIVIKAVGPATGCGGQTSVAGITGGTAGNCGTAGAGGFASNYGDTYRASDDSSSSGGSNGSSGGSVATNGSSNGSSVSGGSSNGSSTVGTTDTSASSSDSPTIASNGLVPSNVPGAPTFGEQVRGTDPKRIDLTLAKISNAVYDDYPNSDNKGVLNTTNNPSYNVDGFRPLTDKELLALGVNPSLTHDEKSGFESKVYSDGQGHYVLAITGTKDNGLLKDKLTDVEQGLGFKTTAYGEADRIAAVLKAKLGDNVVVDGHSLGGGEAASAAAANNLAAVTFNAAGVHDNTLANQDGVDPASARQQAANGQIRAYYLQGEILNTSQRALAPLAPQALGTQIRITDQNPQASLAPYAAPFGMQPLISGALDVAHAGGNHNDGKVISNLSYAEDHPGNLTKVPQS